MQKVINVIALLSGLTSAALIGGSAYLLLNKDALIESAKGELVKAATEAAVGAVAGTVKNSIPKLPSATGGAIPSIPGL